MIKIDRQRPPRLLDDVKRQYKLFARFQRHHWKIHLIRITVELHSRDGCGGSYEPGYDVFVSLQELLDTSRRPIN